MFPLSCAHTGRETSTHSKTWSAHKCSFQKCLCTYFKHDFPSSDEFRWNVAKKFVMPAHRLKKFRGNSAHVISSLSRRWIHEWTSAGHSLGQFLLAQFTSVSIQDVLGLPRPCFPSERPVIKLPSILSHGCLIMRPKQCNFRSRARFNCTLQVSASF